MKRAILLVCVIALARCANNNFVKHGDWSRKEISSLQLSFQMSSSGGIQEEKITYKKTTELSPLQTKS